MSRTAKIAGVAALAGLMMTVAIVAAVQPDEPVPPPPFALPAEAGQDRLARELDRCATLTMPDSGCEAAWAENRRDEFTFLLPSQLAHADESGDAMLVAKVVFED